MHHPGTGHLRIQAGNQARHRQRHATGQPGFGIPGVGRQKSSAQAAKKRKEKNEEKHHEADFIRKILRSTLSLLRKTETGKFPLRNHAATGVRTVSQNHVATVIISRTVEDLEIEKTMPYFIGAHPAFNCPLVEGENYEDYYIEFSEVESCSIPKSFPETGLLDLQDRTPFLENQKILDLDYSLFSHDAITLDQLKSRSVTLRSRKSGKGLRVDFDDFPNLILWSTTNKSPFIALEPWSGLSTSLEEGNFLEDKRQVTKISPQETSRKIYDITILN